MPVHPVNLDALIPRDDFELVDPNSSNKASVHKEGGNLKLSELEPGSFVLSMLRKPDFQRETQNWEPSKVVELVRGFVDEDLIPAIIMWRNPKSGNLFVVDGAHRLSAFIAWIHDDYGDGVISQKFYGNEHSISREQRKAAKQTRDLFRDSRVGTYRDLKAVASNIAAHPKLQADRAKNAGILDIEVQWVTGDARKAEASFFTINQSATAIHPTELRIIKARRKPNAIAARAIMHAGTGHKYWSDFAPPVQDQIEKLAKETYELLFEPNLDEPIKTLDLPVAGRGYSADSLSLVVEFINVANNIKTEMWIEESKRRSKRPTERPLEIGDDQDGAVTVRYLKTIKSVTTRISGMMARSLGLHPAVYFFSSTGRYQPAAFLAVVALIKELQAKPTGFADFTKARGRFEDFLVDHKHFINQIVKNYGSGTRSLEAILAMYHTILDGVAGGEPEAQIVKTLEAHPKLRFLKDEEKRTPGKDVTTTSKSVAYVKKALESGGMRCELCNARLHVRGMNIEHKKRKSDGGSGDSDNLIPVHPYCNSLKNHEDTNEGDDE